MKTVTIDNKIYQAVPIVGETKVTSDQCTQCDGHYDDSLCEKLPDCLKYVYKKVKNGTS